MSVPKLLEKKDLIETLNPPRSRRKWKLELLRNSGIVRKRLKIEAAIANASEYATLA